MMLLYLHGFRSSPASAKSRQLAQAMAERGRRREWACPQLPASPRAAMELVEPLARDMQQHARANGGELTLVGSSLGGYYATWLAERLGCRAALLNPVVHGARDLATQVGEHLSYHDGQPFSFTAGHVDELRAYAVARITRPSRYYLLAATGDEVLDWREMRDHYAGARQHIIEGGDHGITDFEPYLPGVLAFADAAADDESLPG
ncbi:esterase [Pigmentiphaga sp. H8]|uniref:YqiA/YcfP family alpha/beta fold hydrolase n=1 Tax=unclassified Pigmentiphaga TaxID=2626614 RepID=UPI000F5ADECE|nr:YqiA/YcfP family alpha/beta fold hydrolase [Pigmentiphaga sp. H8]AZG10519.1 esterase [Pigmentiphaga sp. H8]